MNRVSSIFNSISMNQIAVGVAIGIFAYPIIQKIMAIALDIFNAFTEYFASVIHDIIDSNIYVMIHSLGCEECANKHRDHI